MPVASGKRSRVAKTADVEHSLDSLTKRVFKAVMDNLRATLGKALSAVKVTKDEGAKRVELRFPSKLRDKVTQAVNRALKAFSAAQFNPANGIISLT